jgi:hypothetical protein
MSCRSDLREAIDQYGPVKGKSSERLKEVCCLALLPAVASLLLVMSTLAVHAAVDDAKAKKWIMAGLTNKMGYAGDPNIDALINKNHKVDEVRAGWQNLKRCRDAGNSLNLDLAAAEHYSYMRLTASQTGDTEIQKLPKWYESFKAWATAVDLEKHLATSTAPVSPVDTAVTSWGEKGVAAGLKDYKAREGKEPTAQSKTLLLMVGVGYATYRKYIPSSGGSCTVSIK